MQLSSSSLLMNVLYLAGAAASVYLAYNWSRLPVLRRMLFLQFIFILLHTIEELRWPGGFVEMVSDKLHFTLASHQLGDVVLASLILIMFLPPLLLPRLKFLAMVPMVLGVLEFVTHTAAIWMFDRPMPYTPGLVTATLLLMPVGVYSITYAVRQHLLRPVSWLLVPLYMLVSVLVAQMVVVSSSGMDYRQFLNNAKGALLGG
ncbi:HXXEE domain-containing protein [Brucella pituitosa]|nr:HXXEE domain-containing protein [Brucella pituitosa]